MSLHIDLLFSSVSDIMSMVLRVTHGKFKNILSPFLYTLGIADLLNVEATLAAIPCISHSFQEIHKCLEIPILTD